VKQKKIIIEKNNNNIVDYNETQTMPRINPIAKPYDTPSHFKHPPFFAFGATIVYVFVCL
jgi:hypothetical protein